MTLSSGVVTQRPNKQSKDQHEQRQQLINSDNSLDLGNNLDDDDKHFDAGMSSLRGDYCNVLVLLFLYVLQGIPLGLAGSIPLILQQKKVHHRCC